MARPAEPPRLDEESLRTWAALATLLEWLPAALDAQLQRDAGITHFEYGILFALSDAADHTLRMSTLASHANSSLSRLSRAVARLEARGWVRRTPDPVDGRYTLAIATDLGVAKAGEAAPGHVALVRHVVFDSLSPIQATQLREISEAVTSAIRSDGGWRPSPAR